MQKSRIICFGGPSGCGPRAVPVVWHGIQPPSRASFAFGSTWHPFGHHPYISSHATSMSFPSNLQERFLPSSRWWWMSKSGSFRASNRQPRGRHDCRARVNEWFERQPLSAVNEEGLQGSEPATANIRPTNRGNTWKSIPQAISWSCLKARSSRSRNTPEASHQTKRGW